MPLCAASLLLEQGKKTRCFAPVPRLGPALELSSWKSLRQPTACSRLSCGLGAGVFTPGFCRVQQLPSVSLHTPLTKTWSPLCQSAAVAPERLPYPHVCPRPPARSSPNAAFLPRCRVNKVELGDETPSVGDVPQSSAAPGGPVRPVLGRSRSVGGGPVAVLGSCSAHGPRRGGCWEKGSGKRPSPSLSPLVPVTGALSTRPFLELVGPLLWRSPRGRPGAPPARHGLPVTRLPRGT